MQSLNDDFKNLMNTEIQNLPGKKDITCKELLSCVDKNKPWLGKTVTRLYYAMQGKGYINENKCKDILTKLGKEKFEILKDKITHLEIEIDLDSQNKAISELIALRNIFNTVSLKLNVEAFKNRR